MRRLLAPSLLAFLLATPAIAQERPPTLADDFKSWDAAEAVTREAPAPAAAEALDADGPAAAAEAAPRDDRRAPSPAAAPAPDMGSRSWWYLVAAIVAGGIILAVLL